MSSSRLFYQNSIICRNISHYISPYRKSSVSNLGHHSLPHSQYRRIILSSSYTNHHLLSKTIYNTQSKSFCTKPPNEEYKGDENKEDDPDYTYVEVDEGQIKKRNYTVLSWRSVIATIIVFGIGTILFQQQIHQHRQKQKKPQYASYGEAQIGGAEWRMVDHNSKEVNQNDLKGKYQVVYFGFTFCPDVCPRELTKMANVCCLYIHIFSLHINGKFPKISYQVVCKYQLLL